MSHAPTTTSELLAVQDTLRAALCAAAEDRPARWGHVTLPGGNTVPAWVADAAKQMAAIVNEHRTRRGLDPASLEHILRVEASAAGHADYAHKYTLRCAQLALGEDDGGITLPELAAEAAVLDRLAGLTARLGSPWEAARHLFAPDAHCASLRAT
jgi:hypothetical protein